MRARPDDEFGQQHNPNADFIRGEHWLRQYRIIPHPETTMRALFVGGTVDNSELDIDGNEPPLHYPPDTGSGQSRYRLHQLGKQEGAVVYAVYGAPDLSDQQVSSVAEERGYSRRFNAETEGVPG